MSCTSDDANLSRYCATLVHHLRPYFTSLDSCCLKVSCIFWLTKISPYSSQVWHNLVLLQFWCRWWASRVDLRRTPVAQWGSNIFQNGFQWCKHWDYGLQERPTNLKIDQNCHKVPFRMSWLIWYSVHSRNNAFFSTVSKHTCIPVCLSLTLSVSTLSFSDSSCNKARIHLHTFRVHEHL